MSALPLHPLYIPTACCLRYLVNIACLSLSSQMMSILGQLTHSVQKEINTWLSKPYTGEKICISLHAVNVISTDALNLVFCNMTHNVLLYKKDNGQNFQQLRQCHFVYRLCHVLYILCMRVYFIKTFNVVRIIIINTYLTNDNIKWYKYL